MVSRLLYGKRIMHKNIKPNKYGGWFEVDIYSEAEKREIINDCWVKGNHKEITHNPECEDAKKLEKILPQLKAYEGTVYRGSNDQGQHDLKVGAEFKFGHITAWSKSKGIAEMHATGHDKLGDNPILYMIENSTKGKDIGKYSALHEEEVLSSKNVKYEVVRIEPFSDDEFFGGRQIMIVVLKEK